MHVQGFRLKSRDFSQPVQGSALSGKLANMLANREMSTNTEYVLNKK